MKLTKRELAVMRVLWEADSALMITEIANRSDDNATVYSIHRIIQSLLKKDMVAVDGYNFDQRTPARKFKPTVKAENIEMTATKELLGSIFGKNVPASHFMAALLPSIYDEDAMKELDKLQEMIAERKKQLLENQEDDEHIED